MRMRLLQINILGADRRQRMVLLHMRQSRILAERRIHPAQLEVTGMGREQAYVGIDPSITNTGLVVLDFNGELLLAMDGKDGYKGLKKAPNAIRHYIQQVKHITDALAFYDIKAIGYEDYSYNSVHKAYSLAEYNGILKADIARTLEKDVVLIAPKRNKRFAVGNGMAGKEPVMAQAHAECPDLPKGCSEDICDAYFLAKYVWYMNDMRTAARHDAGNDFLRLRLEMIREATNGE